MHEFPDKARYNSITETCYLFSRSFLSSALGDGATVAVQLGYIFASLKPSIQFFGRCASRIGPSFCWNPSAKLSVHPVFHNLLCLHVSPVWWRYTTLVQKLRIRDQRSFDPKVLSQVPPNFSVAMWHSMRVRDLLQVWPCQVPLLF